LQYEFLTDEDLLKLATIPEALSDFDRADSMNRLQNRLYTIKNSSIYIEEAKAVIPSLDRTISSDDGVLAISENDAGLIRSFSGGSIGMLVKENNELYSRVRNNSSDNRKSKPLFVFQVKFSNSMLHNTFTSFNVYEGSGSLLYYPDQNYVLSTINDDAVTNQIKKSVSGFDGTKSSYMESFNSNNTRYLAFYQKLDSNDMWLVAYVPEGQVFSPLRMYAYVLWIFTVISIVIIVYFSFSTHKFLQRPLKKLVSAFKRVETGELRFSIQHNTSDEFQYLYARFNAMLDYVNNLIDQVYTQKIMSQKAELKQLQSQINPHFLFNSFFIMQRMIQGDDKENAVKFCTFLGQYFKYVTRNAKEEMPLAEEAEHARNYLEIQAIRFSKTSVEFDELPQRYRNLLVPRLILQPVIENAFEHGLSKNVDRPLIAVRFAEAEEGLYASIEDNGSTADDEEIQKFNRLLSDEDGRESESTGLININKRIKMKFGGRSGVTITRGDLGGWKAVIFFETGRDEDVQALNH
jgi:two-component system sensor histidine kinase YesM